MRSTKEGQQMHCWISIGGRSPPTGVRWEKDYCTCWGKCVKQEGSKSSDKRCITISPLYEPGCRAERVWIIWICHPVLPVYTDVIQMMIRCNQTDICMCHINMPSYLCSALLLMNSKSFIFPVYFIAIIYIAALNFQFVPECMSSYRALKSPYY